MIGKKANLLLIPDKTNQELGSLNNLCEGAWSKGREY